MKQAQTIQWFYTNDSFTVLTVAKISGSFIWFTNTANYTFKVKISSFEKGLEKNIYKIVA